MDGEADTTAPRVLVVGSTPADTIVLARRSVDRPGGVTTYAGRTYRRLGRPVVVVTNVADATLCRPMIRAGIHCACGPSPADTRFVNVVAGDDRRQLMPSAAAPVTAAQVRPWLAGAALVHLGPLHPADLAPDVLALPFDGPVALDVQGYVRRIERGAVVPATSDHLPQALAAADLLKAGADELALVTTALGASLPDLMARFGVREAVVTEGRRGGYVVLPGGDRIPYTAPPVAAVADPTGAGDVFFAAYLTARLFDAAPVPDAAARAAAEAARHVAGD